MITAYGDRSSVSPAERKQYVHQTFFKPKAPTPYSMPYGDRSSAYACGAPSFIKYGVGAFYVNKLKL